MCCGRNSSCGSFGKNKNIKVEVNFWKNDQIPIPVKVGVKYKIFNETSDEMYDELIDWSVKEK